MLGHEYNILEIKSTGVRSIPIMTFGFIIMDMPLHQGHAKE
jgi:hypothetical protein